MEVQALSEHSCPACGAAAEWDPSNRALVCPYCGTRSETETDPDTGVVRELPLAQALRVLSAELRTNRLMKAEEKAARLPAILTVPMIIFIMPALFVVLIGPGALRTVDALRAQGFM